MRANLLPAGHRTLGEVVAEVEVLVVLVLTTLELTVDNRLLDVVELTLELD